MIPRLIKQNLTEQQLKLLIRNYNKLFSSKAGNYIPLSSRLWAYPLSVDLNGNNPLYITEYEDTPDTQGQRPYQEPGSVIMNGKLIYVLMNTNRSPIVRGRPVFSPFLATRLHELKAQSNSHKGKKLIEKGYEETLTLLWRNFINPMLKEDSSVEWDMSLRYVPFGTISRKDHICLQLEIPFKLELSLKHFLDIPLESPSLLNDGSIFLNKLVKGLDYRWTPGTDLNEWINNSDFTAKINILATATGTSNLRTPLPLRTMVKRSRGGGLGAHLAYTVGLNRNGDFIKGASMEDKNIPITVEYLSLMPKHRSGSLRSAPLETLKENDYLAFFRYHDSSMTLMGRNKEDRRIYLEKVELTNVEDFYKTLVKN